MFTWKSWLSALAVAIGAFWLIMGHNPQASFAAPGPAAFSAYDFSGRAMPTAEGGNAFECQSVLRQLLCGSIASLFSIHARALVSSARLAPSSRIAVSVASSAGPTR